MEFQNFSISIDDKSLVEDFNYKLKPGTTILVIGPNGCGKSTFAHAIMGRSDIEVSGKLIKNNTNLVDLETSERANNGVFVSWQTPPEIAGITSFGLVRDIKKVSAKNMKAELTSYKETLSQVDLPDEWVTREVNVGGSGGERKRNELANLITFEPEVAILDEIDTGLDTNGLKTVSKVINQRRENNKITVVITHNKNLLEHLTGDEGLLFKNKKLESVDIDTIQQVLTHGYDT